MTTEIDLKAMDTITGLLGIDVEEAGADLVVLTMPVDGRNRS
jgi:acyl-coenzyme A thioesterase PaaI-like protein